MKRKILYLIWNETVNFDGEMLARLLEVGVDWVQLRCKDKKRAAEEGRKFAAVCEKFPGKEFFVNDFPDVAYSVGAVGVHLGKDDAAVDVVRREFPGLKVGFSCDNSAELLEAGRMDVDYLSLGPVFPTLTKEDVPAPLGVNGVEREMRFSEKLILIGGITLESLPSLLKLDFFGVAVFSDILLSEDPVSRAKGFRRALDIF